MRELWHDHLATPQQQSLPFDAGTVQRGKLTQADLLLSMLRAARVKGEPLYLPAILRTGIAQHSARFNELRRRGFEIVNKMERIDGTVHSWYRLTLDPERDER